MKYIPLANLKNTTGIVAFCKDAKEIVVEILKVFDTKEFVVLDNNIYVLIDAIKVANSHEVIASINGGAEVLDVIDRDGFVKEEILTLSTTSEFKMALPNIMTTTIKIAYRSVFTTLSMPLILRRRTIYLSSSSISCT